MKKVIFSMLLISTLLIMSVFAFDVCAAELTPGLNLLTGTTSALAFENESDVAKFSVTAGTISKGENPKVDSVNGSSGILLNTVLRESGSIWPCLKFQLPTEVEAERPMYVSFKYYKTYNPSIASFSNATFFTIMKNGASEIARWMPAFQPNASTWESFSDFVDFTIGETSEGNLKSIVLEYQVNANPTYPTLVCFDDISYVPAYKLSYMMNDGTEAVVKSEYFLFDNSGNIITEITPDLSVAPEKEIYRFNFKGWSTNPDAVTPDDNITVQLENRDVLLYAVWEEDTSLPAETSYVWDFESDNSKTWTSSDDDAIIYKNGMACLTKKSANTYFAHQDVELNTLAHRYLIFKARSKESGTLTFSFITSEMQELADEASYTVSITASDVFTEYCVDLTENSLWKGNYLGGTLSFDFSKLELEEIALSTTYNPDKDVILEYHYPLANIAPQGHNSMTAQADGSYLFVRARQGSEFGATYLPTPPQGLKASVYDTLVFKTKDVTGFDLLSFYYTSTDAPAPDADRCVNAYAQTAEDGYTYFVYDFSQEPLYTGTIGQFMITAPANGQMLIYDVYLTEKFSTNAGKEIEKQALYASADSIDTEAGEIILAPYTRLADGTEITDYSGICYVTDSVNAVLTKNPDGSATLTGRINGEITVTAILADETRIEKTITISGQKSKLAANSFNVLMLGNSIRRHGEDRDIGWYGKSWGMAASSREQDYAHRFVYYMEEKYGKGSVNLSDTASIGWIERAITGSSPTYDFTDYISPLVDTILEEKPDIITVQMGENVGEVTVEQYQNATTQLIRAFKQAAPNAVIVMTTPFWPDYVSKQTGTYNTAEECGISVAPVHTLYCNENMAFDSPFVANATDGVKMHPGDSGMDGIAQLLFEQVNRKLSENERTVYTELPIDIEIDAENESISVPYGTLELNAIVYPDTAAQEVVWSVSDTNIAEVTSDGVLKAKNNGTVTVTAVSKYAPEVKAECEITVTGQTLPYTVTFNKNTTDEVTGMPEPYEYAKDLYTFEKVYPVRKTYTFLGWSLTPDGDAVESINITENTTVYAVWEKAAKWSFDRTDYKEEFVLENAFNQYVLGGQFMAMATYTNVSTGEVLTVNSPELDIDASEYKYLVIRMQNTAVANDTVLNMVIKTDEGEYNFSHPVTTTEFTEYLFDLSDVTGTITGFTFTPTNIDCTINLDEIAFLKDISIVYHANAGTDSVTNMPEYSYFPLITGLIPEREGYEFLGWSKAASSKVLVGSTVNAADEAVHLYAVWNKYDHWEFDSEDFYIDGVESDSKSLENGILTYTGTGDPIIIPKKGSGFMAEPDDKIIVRMKWNEDRDTYCTVFFKTDIHTDYNEVSVTVYGGIDDWQIIELDMGGNSNWSGKVTYLRFDVSAGVGQAQVDYIRFADSEMNKVVDSTANGRLVSESSSVIIKKGVTATPDGKTELGAIHLAGELDMSEGYVIAERDAEVSAESDYAVFTLDMSEEYASGADAMYISGYNAKVEMKNGGKYIVKAYNGSGYAAFGNSDNITFVKVTGDGGNDETDFAIVVAGYVENRMQTVKIVKWNTSETEKTVVVDGCDEIRFIAVAEKSMVQPVFEKITQIVD